MELIQQAEILNRIFIVRGLQIMLDQDLATMYTISTGRLNEQVKRNIDRFPPDFMFQLTEVEWENLLSQNAIVSNNSLSSQNAILKNKRGSHRKYLPYVFTEQGVAGLSGVLKSETATQIHVAIMRAFVSLRKMVNQNSLLIDRLQNVENKHIEYDQKFEQLFKALEKNTPTPDTGIIFDGQVFDAYVFVSDLIKQAKKEIILIDNYLDETVLTMLSKRNKGVTVKLYTKTISKALQLDVVKHQGQYPPISIHHLTESHDRFMIIDQNQLYHLGASLKDVGKKWFAFSRMDGFAKQVLNQIQSVGV